MENKIKKYLKMYVFYSLKCIFSDVFLRSQIDISSLNIDITEPPEDKYGHYTTNVAFQISKYLKENPFVIATKIVQFKNNINSLSDSEVHSNFIVQPEILDTQNFDLNLFIEFIEKGFNCDVASPGFINFIVSSEYLMQELITYNCNSEDILIHKGKKFLIEHTSANPNKDMHVGHLRNNLIGSSIANIWEATGAVVIRDYVINDRGIAIAKLMWGYLKYARKDNTVPISIDFWYKNKHLWYTPPETGCSGSRFVDEYYTKGSIDFDEDKEVENIVRQLVVDWENSDPMNIELWQYLINFAIEGHKLILDKLGSKIDKFWKESEHYKKGKELVEYGLNKRIFVKLEDGAVLSDLKQYNLPDTILLKRDGTSLYITQDLALTKLKKDTYKPDLIAWVVGPEQSLSFQQLFAICEQLGIGKREEFKHISFGYVTIKGTGKISSRKGNAIYVTDLLDQVVEKIRERLVSSNKFNDSEIQEISEALGIGSVKYSILKITKSQNIEFDLNTVTSLEGDSLPYVMYSIVRAKSILNNLKNLETLSNIEDLSIDEIDDSEIKLTIALINYKEVLVNASIELSPNILCNHIYKLAQFFNKFYNSVIINGVEQDKQKVFDRRRFITKIFVDQVTSLLSLLGIQTIEKM